MDQSVDLDVDNLFSEENLNQATLDQEISLADHTVLQAASSVLPPGLTDRIASLSQNGCSAGVAWSRQGHIAKIINDGAAVELQCQRFNCKTNQWDLCEPTVLDATFDLATSIAWGPSGVELAVADSKGRVSIFSMTTTCLNRLNEGRSSLADPIDEMGIIVGMLWLNQDKPDKPKTLIRDTKKEGDRWNNSTIRGRALPPLYHRAIIVVSQVGMIAIIYQRPDGQFRRNAVKLPVSPASIFTHAAIAPTVEGKLLVVLHSVDFTIQAFSATVVIPADLRTNPSSETLPSISVQTIDSHVPSLPPFTDVPSNGPGVSLIETWLLTHLEIVPSSEILPDQGENEPPRSTPILNAVYTPYHQGANAVDPGFLQPSIVRRWSIQNAALKLHPRFNDIQSNGTVNVEDVEKIVLQRLPDINFPQIISSFQSLEMGNTIAISTQDGRTELWKPETMSPVMYEPGSQTVSSLVQAGFSLPASMSATMQCVSANACAVATVDNEGVLSIGKMAFEELSQQPGNTKCQIFDPSNNSSHDAAIAAYMLALSRSCWSNANADDVLSSVHATVHPTSIPSLIKALYVSLCKPTDFISEQMQGSELSQVVQKALNGKVLSFHLVLYKNPAAASFSEFEAEVPRELKVARLWAWMSINLRYTTTMFYLFHQSINPPRPQPGQTSQPPPQNLPTSFVNMVCNNIRWTFGVLNFLFQSILEVGDRQSHPDMFEPPSFESLLGDEKGDGSQGLVALLLSCNWSRIFLAHMAKVMRAYVQKGGQSPNSLAETPLGKVVTTIQHCIDAHGLSLAAVEILVGPRWYADTPDSKTGWQPDSTEVMNRQIEMMSTGVVPEVYQKTVQKLLDGCINGENGDGLRGRGEIDRLKLLQAMPDRAWLLLNMDDIVFQHHTPTDAAISTSSHMVNGNANGINGTSHSKPPRRLIDVHKKAFISFDGKGSDRIPSKQNLLENTIRRCVRCGSLSEDVLGMDRSWPRNMVQFMARCVCDGHWILEKFGETV